MECEGIHSAPLNGAAPGRFDLTAERCGSSSRGFTPPVTAMEKDLLGKSAILLRDPVEIL
jgi:hypothetical protein